MTNATVQRMIDGLKPWNSPRLREDQRLVGEAITQNMAQALFPDDNEKRVAFLRACGVSL